MEPWAPCEFHLPNWTVDEEPGAEVLSPAGHHVEYASIDIFHPYSLQACVHESSVGYQQQLVEYRAEASEHNPIEKVAQDSFEVAFHSMEMEICKNPISVFQEVAHEFEDDIKMMKMKIHKYPEIIRALGDWCAVPKFVAIGPYHHGREQLNKVEQVKHVAAYHCIRESGYSVREVYDAVVSAADDARHLYDKDVIAGISYDDFRHMMFFDACFLVQYMVWCTDGSDNMDPSLNSFFYSNRKGMHHDVSLHENQLPWQVVEAVMRFRPLSLEQFLGPCRGILQNRWAFKKMPLVLDDSYDPPHLLGLIRHYIVGSTSITEPHAVDNIELVSLSFSAIELAEIGITLTANETTDLTKMGLHKKGIFFAELSMAPIYLNYARATRLVNMAALELCTTSNFLAAKDEDTAVCSYLLLLSMLVHREEDVHELRTKGILQGGAGLTNKEALDFFTRLQNLPHGSCCARTMIEIDNYRINRRIRTKVHAFIHKKKRTICTVLSTIVAVFSIFGTLIGILVKLKSIKSAP
ncbi:unnamed protein product [Urochloa humidicola]